MSDFDFGEQLYLTSDRDVLRIRGRRHELMSGKRNITALGIDTGTKEVRSTDSSQLAQVYEVNTESAVTKPAPVDVVEAKASLGDSGSADEMRNVIELIHKEMGNNSVEEFGKAA
ncbi:MAG: hypothetical protein U0451_00125 [Candidatus Saccharimonadales bacterium]